MLEPGFKLRLCNWRFGILKATILEPAGGRSNTHYRAERPSVSLIAVGSRRNWELQGVLEAKELEKTEQMTPGLSPRHIRAR